MRAGDLAEPYPAVCTDDDAMDAARLFVERRLPALLVLDRDGRPYAIVPGSQLLKVMVPDFVLRDTSLARTFVEGDVQTLSEALAGLSVAQWLPGPRVLPTVVGLSADVLEVAALMVTTRTPLVAVVESDGERTRTTGAISAARLMEHFLDQP
ncbi:CBS domain-containing protein [Streptomyces halobius]|uniref:CBS domain-containing protein n=1 Tax=Streptomyces halobius TaxID=2879846 RepID=A0ABY4M588_9ACTN|nr:CBS domain-containing protein [Streptomyces halobius]UQA91546.1 CBS domain-containing protein [Streptomyces halobius]